MLLNSLKEKFHGWTLLLFLKDQSERYWPPLEEASLSLHCSAVKKADEIVRDFQVFYCKSWGRLCWTQQWCVCTFPSLQVSYFNTGRMTQMCGMYFFPELLWSHSALSWRETNIAEIWNCFLGNDLWQLISFVLSFGTNIGPCLSCLRGNGGCIRKKDW